MEIFFITLGVVALSEIGDKTQILCVLLTAKFKKPVSIIIGIILATILNHGLAAWAGQWISTLINPHYVKGVLGLIFVVMGIFTLATLKKKADEKPPSIMGHWGVLGATFITYFFAEMGDKTQLASFALSAQSHEPFLVTIAGTLGILLADIPAIFLTKQMMGKASLWSIKLCSAILFLILGATIWLDYYHLGIFRSFSFFG